MLPVAERQTGTEVHGRFEEAVKTQTINIDAITLSAEVDGGVLGIDHHAR